MIVGQLAAARSGSEVGPCHTVVADLDPPAAGVVAEVVAAVDGDAVEPAAAAQIDLEVLARAWPRPLDHRVEASSSIAIPASPEFADAVAPLMPHRGKTVVEDPRRRPRERRDRTAGGAYANDWPPIATANERGSSFSLRTTRTVDPSGLRNATSVSWPFQPVVPKFVLATSTAPGMTNLQERHKLDALHVDLATKLVVRGSTGPVPR